TLITKNPKDFRDLQPEWQAQKRPHFGILLIYEDNIRGKDMEPADIVRAIGKLLASGLPVRDELHILNHWRERLPSALVIPPPARKESGQKSPSAPSL